MEWPDVHIETVQAGTKIRMRPLPGQERNGQKVPRLWISGSKQLRERYPVGTVFVADLQLVRPDRSGDYLKIRTGHEIEFLVSDNIKKDIRGQLIIFDNLNSKNEGSSTAPGKG
jgi:hypothetical protein